MQEPVGPRAPVAEAVDQLRRYGNQRRAAFEVDDNEGNESLFATNLLLVATSYDQARVGCVGAGLEHYAQWKTVVGPDGTGSEAACCCRGRTSWRTSSARTQAPRLCGNCPQA